MTSIKAQYALKENLKILTCEKMQIVDHQESNFPKNGMVICFYCKSKMAVKEGTVIFGDKWFHESCIKKYED